MNDVSSDFSDNVSIGVQPRIMADKSDFEAIRASVLVDSDKEFWFHWLIQRADEMCDELKHTVSSDRKFSGLESMALGRNFISAAGGA